jgi:hypothetical protein
MSDGFRSEDTLVEVAPRDLVSFSVVCRPRPGVTAEEFLARLTLTTLGEYLAPPQVREQVRDQLRTRGFEVFDHPSPVVSARGSVELFESVFDARLAKRLRRFTTARSESRKTAIVRRPGSRPPSPEPISGALHIAVMAPPVFVAPSIPPITPFNLHLPGDIGQLTGAAATHRLATPARERATGAGVGVAVIDTGFAPHPYYEEHGYRVTRLAAPDTTFPEEDDEPHGTCILASLFACAPDADGYGIKVGANAVLAFDLAMTLTNLKVLSLSWVHDLAGEAQLPLDLIPLRLSILTAVSAGITVITAAGNGQTSFPAMMPEVIAVGGVAVDTSDTLSAWSGSSSFTASIYRGRNVPDFCAISSQMLVPIPGKPPDWISIDGGTSCATPQVAGIAALLLQKDPTLAPEDIRSALATTATDVTAGSTAMGTTANKGTDLATGAGFVNALPAWQSI